MTTHKMYWRKIALDSAWVPMAFFSAYLISSYFNFSDNYYIWARQYEQSIDIDELLPALMASLLALLWFSKRRVNESRTLFQKNNALLQRILKVQEDERKRIARDLHDDLGQYLSAINAQASSLILDARISKNAQLTAKSITSSANHAYRATQNLIRSLRPAALDELGLSAALEHLVDTWRLLGTSTELVESNLSRMSHNQTNYHLHIHSDIDSYNENINITVFRIIQEALTNISKHAHASTVSIHIQYEQHYLEIEIIDDGVGFDKSKQNAGYGLLGIAERIEALGGNLEITSQTDTNQPNSGTKINVQIKVLHNEKFLSENAS